MYGYYYNAGKTWEDVKLWQATKDNDQIDVQIDTFINADNYWDIGTFKNFAEEMKQVLKADYSYPIIIDEKYELVDGAHRIVHAYLDGVKTVKAVIIDNEQWPEPDYDEVKACEMAYLQKESKAKFKIGDTIRHKEEGNVFKILDIKDGCYEFEHGVIIDIVAQDKWELAEEPKDCMYSTANFTNADRLTLCKDCKELCRYNQKTAAESLGISQEAYDEIVDKCLYGSEVELVDGGDLPKEEPVSEEFEEALTKEWQGYVDRGAATVDALEDNTQELAFAKGFYRGSKWQKE